LHSRIHTHNQLIEDFLKMSRQPPPHLSDLLHGLGDAGRLFIDQYESQKKRMQAIAGELCVTSLKVQEIQESANTRRMMGAVVGGLGIVVALAICAVLPREADINKLTTAQLIVAFAGVIALIAGQIAAFSGGIAVLIANLVEALEEITIKQTVEDLGKEFMEIIEEQKDILKDIMDMSEELEKTSSSLLTKTKSQSKESLTTAKQLKQALKRTAELTERSKQVMDVSALRSVINCIAPVIRITPNSEHGEKLRNCIRGSADQCGRTLHEFAKMRSMLTDFEDMETGRSNIQTLK